jgi:predicted polyphosphate/ATP-dependent NAD kinase
LRIGFIVNPIAGMGGRVGLKGTDGEEVLKEALAKGATSWAPHRARETLTRLTGASSEIEWITWPGEMGEGLLREMGFDYEVHGSIGPDTTTAEDTRQAAHEMERQGVGLILFAGGDGTASDIVGVVGMRVPILGIPSGVKMFSAVFSPTPGAAARLVLKFLDGEVKLVEREVMDIDEEAYRSGRLSASLKGYAVTPYAVELVLGGKSVSSGADEGLMKEAIASRVVEEMVPGVSYVLGPGSTVAKVAEVMGVEKTILGIDVVRDGEVVLSDADEEGLLDVVDGDTWIVLSPLGGQGSLLGRGNQPISPRVLRRVGLDRLIVISTPTKLLGLGTLTVDTGNPELDQRLRGYRRVIVGYREEKVVKVV